MTGENRGGREDYIDSSTGEEAVSADAAISGAWLENLLARRLIFVMGKGGVGKTTISIALANAASRLKKKVLLAELGDADSIGKFYGQSLADAPARLSRGIWGARVDAKVELEAYVRAHVASKLIAGKISGSRLFDYLFEAAPGLKEIMSLGRLWRWERGDPRLSAQSFDLIIVDSPATGHALSLLRLPDLLFKMIRVGPVANQLRSVLTLLKNHQKTAIALVTLAEELPVNETIEFYKTAEDSLDMPVAAIFINCVYPDLFSLPEIQKIQSLKKSRSFVLENVLENVLLENVLIDCAVNHFSHRISQQKHMRKLYETTRCPVQKMRFYFTNDMTLSEIKEMSFAIDPDFSNLPGKTI